MERERAILVGVDWIGPGGRIHRAELDELAELAAAAGAIEVARFVQRRERPDPAHHIGRGKVRELGAAVEANRADLVICDDDLTPAQQRNLEDAVGVKVVDRTGLILDIFSQRARTKEAKVQVEMAQLSYILPRLGGKGTELSRLGGGIGTRGPGETKLEADRRRIRQRLVELRHELAEIKNQRVLMRQPRAESGVPVVALVGYTNAGKSTLFNALTGEAVTVENRLFATLDPTLRQMELPDRQRAILADTVGFIRKLPHQLVAAFRATLEEVVEADLLLHVLDASAPDHPERSQAVQSVLTELGAGDHPAIMVLNKIDLLDRAATDALRYRYAGAVTLSAREGWGLDALRRAVAGFFASRRRPCRLFLPYAASGVLSRLHEEGLVKSQVFRDDGVEVVAVLDSVAEKRLREYRMDAREHD